MDALFAGALYHAPSEVLLCWAKKEAYRPQPWHDLVMLVRAAFEAVNPLVFGDLVALVHWSKETSSTRFAIRVSKAWDHLFALHPVWKELDTYARSTDYSKLQECFTKSLPLHDIQSL